jgi:Domain of unknown function (DUF4864)
MGVSCVFALTDSLNQSKRGIQALTRRPGGLAVTLGTSNKERLPMRNRLYAVMIAAVLAMPAAAQEEPIRKTIQSQIDAFRADDFARAFTFASPNIKGIFGTPENFGAMVREGYPMVYRPAEVEMQELRDVAGNLWQRVRVVDQAGQAWYLDYMMVETPEGWQINAVQLLPAPDVGV